MPAEGPESPKRSASKALLAVHVFLLLGIVVEYALLLSFSETADRVRSQLTIGAAVFSAAWPTALLLGRVFYGKEETFQEELSARYRSLLGRALYGWALNAAMLAVAGVLLYQLLAYRQVEFFADKDVRVLSNTGTGAVSVGELPAGKATRLRLKTGSTQITFESNEAGIHYRPVPLVVAAAWETQARATIRPERVSEKVVARTAEARTVDLSGLILRLSQLEQGTPVVSGAITYLDEPIFFDTLKGRLVLSHNEAGPLSLNIEQVGIQTEIISLHQGGAKPPRYSIDVLNQKPHGITEIGRFFFTLRGASATARYLGGLEASQVKVVTPSNILESEAHSHEIPVTPNGKDSHTEFKVTVGATAPALYHVRFVATYDVAGQERREETKWVYLYKQ